MRVKNSVSSYPILYDYKDDYVGSSFRAEIDAKDHFGTIIIDVRFKLQDETIKELIQAGTAAYVLHVECPSLSVRHEFTTIDDHINMTLDADDVSETLEICTFIVLQKDIAAYENPHFHPEYQGFTFSLMKGQMLAIGDAKSYDVMKSKDKLRSLSSIIRVSKMNDNSKGTLVVNTDRPDYVSVGLTEEAYGLYCQMGKKEYPKAILSLVLLPAMITLLQRVSRDPDVYSECRWFETLTDLLENNDHTWQELSTENGETVVLSIAQAIFSNPVLSGLKELKSSLERE